MGLGNDFEAAQGRASEERRRLEAQRRQTHAQEHAAAEQRRAHEERLRVPIEQFLRSMKAAGNPGSRRWWGLLRLTPSWFKPKYWHLSRAQKDQMHPDDQKIFEGEPPWRSIDIHIDARGQFRSNGFAPIAPPHNAEHLLAECLVRHSVSLLT